MEIPHVSGRVSAECSSEDLKVTLAELQQKAHSLEVEVQARKSAEEAVRLREKELADFLENAIEGLHRVGPDGKILWANRAELEMLGYERDEYVGQSLRDFHVDADAFDGMFSELLAGKSLHDRPMRMRCKDGAIKHVRIHSNGLWEEGRFVHTRCFTRDVTELMVAGEERERLLESERAARAEAERASMLKDEFVAILSHELRTPLNAILGWANLLQGKLAGDARERAHGLAVIERNARLQGQLVSDLLDMGRMLAGNLKLELHVVDPSAVIAAAVESVLQIAQEKGLHLECIVDPLSGWVSADPGRLQQIVWNLLTNAIKFTPPGGRIGVRLQRSGTQVEILVTDSGIGIEPAFLPHVFERFRQADPSNARRHGGLGIGLGVVKQLAELHGGTARVTSPGKDQGSTFTVSLPVVERSSVPATPAADSHAEVCGRFEQAWLAGVDVLVVEDEADSRELVRRVLEENGARVRTAASGQEALTLLESFEPAILVSDIGMAEIDGYTLIRKIRADGRSREALPAIALTALSRSEDRIQAMLAGYQAHVSKPVNRAELIAAIVGLLGQARR